MVLSEKSRPKSAFVSSFGKWEFKWCPFGLAQAPAYVQRLANEDLSGLSFAFGYLYDILVYSPDMETHLEHLRSLFVKLREADLKLKEVKCNFLKKHIQYLGHIFSGKGITPVPEKLESIQRMPLPKTPKEVKQFLGLIGYYHKFVLRFFRFNLASECFNKERCHIWMDPHLSRIFLNVEDQPYERTYSDLPCPQPSLCFIHWCKQICLGLCLNTRENTCYRGKRD